jgi:perosamine synthetase
MPDVLCALGLAQLPRLDGWIAARQRIAALYDAALAGLAEAAPLKTHGDRTHAYHLYVVKLADHIDRDRVFARLRAEGIGANVHYGPVHLHAHYRKLGYGAGLAPVAEAAARQILTLPMFPAMTQADVDRVVGALVRATA